MADAHKGLTQQLHFETLILKCSEGCVVRPLEYDKDVVLSSALKCFWKRGFAATSMRDLEKATKLSTGSIYNSFGNKEKLFEQSFDFYVDKVINQRIEDYLQCEDARAGILDFFEDSLNRPADVRIFGCLLVNTAIEFDMHSETMRSKMNRAHRRVNAALENALMRGIEAGTINKNLDAAVMAQHLGLILSGLLVKVKTSKDTAWHADTMRFIANLLD